MKQTRIALGVEYDGSGYSGWQIQHNAASVQACVEMAISKVANHPLKVICAGRTDTAVHALNQVIHFDTTVMRDLDAWVRGTNANLPTDISILWAREVAERFHARFSAHKRSYRYVIFNRNHRPTFLAGRVAWDYRRLDEARMREAAKFLVGTLDFNAYRAVACQAKSSVRTVYGIEIKRKNEFVVIDIEANAFLHHMVRNIAGVLMTIGAGEQKTTWSKDVLNSKDRRQGGVTAPPQGLYLMDVEYPAEFDLPKLATTSMVW